MTTEPNDRCQAGWRLSSSTHLVINRIVSLKSRGWRFHRVLCPVCGALGDNPGMPRLRYDYGLTRMHSITARAYRRARQIDSDRFRRPCVARLAARRAELSCKIIG
jgi:hypothetical protein